MYPIGIDILYFIIFIEWILVCFMMTLCYVKINSLINSWIDKLLDKKYH